jgi:hypothetical protein
MRTLFIFLSAITLVSCKEDDSPAAPCIQVPERTIRLEDSLMIVNCNDFELGVTIKGENEHHAMIDSDTLYLHFDTTGTFILYYYKARELSASPPFYELPLRIN